MTEHPRPTTTEHPRDEELFSFVHEGPDAPRRDWIADHVLSCTDCARRVEELLDDELAHQERMGALDPDRVRVQLVAEKPRRSWWHRSGPALALAACLVVGLGFLLIGTLLPDPESARIKGDALVAPARLYAVVMAPNGSGIPTPLGARHLPQAGSELAFSLSAQRPGTLYVLHRHPAGQVELLLPRPGSATGIDWPGGDAPVMESLDVPLLVVLPREPGVHVFVALVGPPGERRGTGSVYAVKDSVPETEPLVDQDSWSGWVDDVGWSVVQAGTLAVEVAR